VKLVTFEVDGADHVGVMLHGGTAVLDATSASGSSDLHSMRGLIDGGEASLQRLRELLKAAPPAAIRGRDEVRLRAPLPDPIRMRDCTLFIEHLEPGFKALARQEAAAAADPAVEYQRLIATGKYDLPAILRRQPVYYNADHLAISGPDDVVLAPPFSQFLDYELEFAVVLGRSGRDISEAEAANFIFGYTIYNDWSLRDVQADVMRSNLGPGEGKDFDGGTSLGPCIVTRDELMNPYALEMSARVNGEEWSRGNSATIHHTFERAIAHFSRSKTLYAAEVFGSGTVLSGCGLELGRTLREGDIVELEVEGIGVLRNRVSYMKKENT